MSHPPTSSQHLMPEVREAGLDDIRQSPADDGMLKLIVRRLAVDWRDVLDTDELDPVVGLWATAGRPEAVAPPQMDRPTLTVS